MLQPRTWLLLLMVLFPVALRMVEHPWNMAPIGALALFVGAHLRGKSWAFLVPLCAMFLSDVALGLHKGDIAFYTFHGLVPVIYACFALYVCLGLGIRRCWNKRGAQRQTDAKRNYAAWTLPVMGATVAGPVLFFLITNFAHWAVYDTYPKTGAGLIQCYVAGLPYFRSMLAGDAFFVTSLFGGFALLKHYLPASEPTALHVEKT